MNIKTPLIIGMVALAGMLSSCTVGNPNPPKQDTGVESTTAPAETETATATETPAPVETEAQSTEAPNADDVTTVPEDASETINPEETAVPADTTGFVAGQPIPDSELANSRVAKQMRYVASRLKDYVAANGVPSDWEMNGFSYISTIYTDAEAKAWDNGVMVPFMGRPDGSFTLRGWGQTPDVDPKFKDFNTGLEYDSKKGFITG